MILEVHSHTIIDVIKLLESTDTLGRWVEFYVNRHVTIKIDRLEYLKQKRKEDDE